MWTTDQITRMRTDRPVYRDTVQNNEIAWIRTGEDTGGEYSLPYSDSSPGYGVFPHFHTWRNTGDARVRFIVEVRPAYPEFEKWLAVLQNMSSDGMTHPDGRPKNPYHGALIMVGSDIHLAGRDRLMMPVFHLLARRARRKGMDRELEERYWHQR